MRFKIKIPHLINCVTILQNPLRITDKDRDFLQEYDCAQNESEVLIF
jgi:hypothetical protein